MHTPNSFEQFARGLANPESFKQWLGPLLPKGTDATALFTQPSTQWLTSVQSMLKGSDTLRHMQIEAINSARRQASELASTLARAKSPVEAGKAWQQFSQENLRHSLEYWTAYSAIIRDTEMELLSQAGNGAGKIAKAAPARSAPAKTAKRRVRAKGK